MPPRPWFVFEITPDCNADCIYCYNVWKAPGAGRPVPLDTRAAAGLIRKLRAEAEPAGITFTGGEPLLRDDLVELVSAASTAGIPRICIATNGVLLTPELAGRLTGAGARHFEVSLPSSDRAIYESLCGLDALTAAREAIRHAVSAGTEVSVAVMLGGPTLSCVADVVSTAFAYGARAVV
ncbi:radical SAM protein, partial [Candidatus Fermentibacterales bacterium]|nr:radical SAM protein [Candidatus Fermentibacterales bacterium]